ncbi:hypothetical protein XCY_001542 [Xanthomonas arboricola pv. juglandis]|nr:hypothetical protein XCY_001542 [Xanthomonas arboricola pv. juglandis]
MSWHTVCFRSGRTLGSVFDGSDMQEPNKSALVLLQQEATELLALFDQLRGDAVPAHDADNVVATTPAERTEQTVNVTN